MVESKLTYLTIEQGTELSAVFKNLGFHQYQDPLRSVFVHQPCYTYSVDGTVVAFAILELHRLKKASIWLGPVFNSEINKDLIWDDFFKQLQYKIQNTSYYIQIIWREKT